MDYTRVVVKTVKSVFQQGPTVILTLLIKQDYKCAF